MKISTSIFICSTLVLGICSAFDHLPNDATKAAIAAYLTKFAQQHHVPCFVAGFQVYKTKNQTVTGNSRWEYVNPGGLADIENEVQCKFNTVLRVASVSKSIGSGLVASLVEQGKLQWDEDINKYVPESVFPKKTWNGE